MGKRLGIVVLSPETSESMTLFRLVSLPELTQYSKSSRHFAASLGRKPMYIKFQVGTILHIMDIIHWFVGKLTSGGGNQPEWTYIPLTPPKVPRYNVNHIQAEQMASRCLLYTILTLLSIQQNERQRSVFAERPN